MKCRKAKSILASDGLLLNEHQTLSEHLAVCSECAVEAERFRAISEALREMKSPAKIPDGLAGQVINRLRSQSANQEEIFTAEPHWRFRWSQSWKRSLAAAAAVVVLIGGSMGIATRLGVLNIPGSPALVAKSTSNQPAAKIPAQVRKTENTPQDGNKSVQPQKNTQRNDSSSNDLPESEKAANKPATKAATQQQAATQQTTIEPKIFLNVPRSIECALLKIKVDNINDSTDRMLSWAKTGGISYTVENKIPLDDGRTINIFRFGVPNASVDKFSNFISGLGRILERDSNTRNVTDEFAGELERYHNLLAQKEKFTGRQTAQIDSEIKAVETELTQMDKEAQDQVIFIVWLEN